MLEVLVAFLSPILAAPFWYAVLWIPLAVVGWIVWRVMPADRRAKWQASVALLLLLAACDMNRVVVLERPQTKQIVECRREPLAALNQIAPCVRAYEAAGYRVVGDSDRD